MSPAGAAMTFIQTGCGNAPATSCCWLSGGRIHAGTMLSLLRLLRSANSAPRASKQQGLQCSDNGSDTDKSCEVEAAIHGCGTELEHRLQGRPSQRTCRRSRSPRSRSRKRAAACRRWFVQLYPEEAPKTPALPRLRGAANDDIGLPRVLRAHSRPSIQDLQHCKTPSASMHFGDCVIVPSQRQSVALGTTKRRSRGSRNLL